SRRRHTRLQGDWSSDVCSSDLLSDSAMLSSSREAVMNAIAGVGKIAFVALLAREGAAGFCSRAAGEGAPLATLCMRGRRRLSSCRRHADINAIVAHLHVDGTQAIFRIAAVAAGLDVEFPPVPGADDVALFRKTKAAAGLIRRELFLDPRDHLALTHRPAVVRAMVLVCHETVALAKNSELEAIDAQHAIATLREFAELAHHDFIHRFTRHPVNHS